MNIYKICNALLVTVFSAAIIGALYFTDRFAFGKAPFSSIAICAVVAFCAMAVIVVFDKGDTK